jgi:LemA protein
MVAGLIISLAVAIGFILLILGMFFFYFNRFVRLENGIDNSLAQIDVQLKKRADLVPNLINTVKGYAKLEKGIMADVTSARKAMVSAKSLPARMKAGADLQSALGSIFAIAENYPQLKANEGFVQLQQELSAIEDKVAYSRQYYNDSIFTYNNSVETFPGRIFASMLGKTEKEMLQIKAEERIVPKVNFSDL